MYTYYTHVYTYYIHAVPWRGTFERPLRCQALRSAWLVLLDNVFDGCMFFSSTLVGEPVAQPFTSNHVVCVIGA